MESEPKAKTDERDEKEQNKKWLAGAGIAACVLVIGGGAYWTLGGSAKPKTSLATSASEAVQGAATTLASPSSAASAPAQITATGTTSAATSTEPVVPESAKVAAPETDANKPDEPQAAASTTVPITEAVKPPLEIAKPKQTQAELNAREEARKKQAERDQVAKQKLRDRANMNKANRTLDDLLK